MCGLAASPPPKPPNPMAVDCSMDRRAPGETERFCRSVILNITMGKALSLGQAWRWIEPTATIQRRDELGGITS